MAWDKTLPLIGTILIDSHPQILANWVALETAIGISGGVLEPATPKSLFDANTILAAASDNTPAALTVAASRIVGRASTGNIAALTAAQVFTLLGITSFAQTILDDADAATARTTLGLVIGTNVQAYDATLLSIAALGTAADKMLYSTAIDTWVEASLTAAGRALLDDADAAAQLITLGLTATATELNQLATMDATTISAAQWGYLGGLDQALATTNSPTFTNLTISTLLVLNRTTSQDAIQFSGGSASPAATDLYRGFTSYVIADNGTATIGSQSGVFIIWGDTSGQVDFAIVGFDGAAGIVGHVLGSRTTMTANTDTKFNVYATGNNLTLQNMVGATITFNVFALATEAL